MELRLTRLGYPTRLIAQSERYGPGMLIAGKYRLESLLGQGGMGTVWLARNETLNAPVALKLIRSGMQCDETMQRLLVEAHVEAKLKHPNIVRVFDFGTTDLGDAFIVMEVLDGLSLGELLRECGRLGATEAVRLVMPVIGALCHAHEHGVVHRDIKPHNVFLDLVGLHAGTKLLDFGIAKLMGDDAHRRLTPGGLLLGSPAYMAPEQARDLVDVDHRADIWAMCVVLYEAISGTPPFSGEDHVVLRKIVDDEVSALEDTGPAGSALWAILRRGLEKDPARRFQSMRELGTALAQWLCNQGETEDLDGNRISRNWGVAGVAEASASLPPGSGMALQPRKVRPRRYVQMFERSPETPLASARALRSRRISERAVITLRIVAVAGAMAVVLLPSTIGVEPAMRASTGQPQRDPVEERGSVHVARAAPTDPRLFDAVLPRAVAPLVREPRDLKYLKRHSPRPTEANLGLKVPY